MNKFHLTIDPSRIAPAKTDADMFAWVATALDKSGVGIVTITGNDGTRMPLIDFNREIIDAWGDVVRDIATTSGATIRLMRLSVAEVLRVVHP